jgi:uncharacterized membrane protein YtjA (UPF0391 family)
MTRFATAFLIIGLVAGCFGFGGMLGLTWDGAKIVCGVFLTLAGLSYFVGTAEGRSFWWQ